MAKSPKLKKKLNRRARTVQKKGKPPKKKK